MILKNEKNEKMFIATKTQPKRCAVQGADKDSPEKNIPSGFGPGEIE